VVVVVVVVENGGGISGMMEKRRIVRGLVSVVRHVLCLCPVFFFWQPLAGVLGSTNLAQSRIDQ